MLNFSKKYSLNAWNKETYEKIIEKSWANVQKEPLLIKGDIHPAIITAIEEISKINNKSGEIKENSETISSVLKNRSNDYSNLERIFKDKSNCELLDWSPSPLRKFGEKVSIIIPTYNSFNSLKLTLASINRQKLNLEQKKMVEVVVIDDGSTDHPNKILKERYSFNLKYFKQNNLGRVCARNLGATLSFGEILFFLDSDVVL